MNANTDSNAQTSSQEACLTCMNTKYDLSALLGTVPPEDKLSRQFFLSSRLALAWVTQSARYSMDGMWMWRARELIITAASGCPRLCSERDAEQAYIWALSLEAIEIQAEREPEGTAARDGLMCLPGYQVGAKTQSAITSEQHGYVKKMLLPFYDLAWRTAELYLALPEPEWREVEHKVLESSINLMFEKTGGIWPEEEKRSWLAELQKDLIGSSIAKSKGTSTGTGTGTGTGSCTGTGKEKEKEKGKEKDSVRRL